MKKLLLIAILGAFLLTGCKLPQVNIIKPDITKDEAFDLLTFEAAYQLGKLAAKEMPDQVPTILEYCDQMGETEKPIVFQTYIDTGKNWLVEKLGGGEHYKRQMDRVFPKIEIVESEEPSAEWMEKVKPLLEEFILGIEDARPDAHIQAFIESYHDRYVEFLLARTLAVGGV